MMKFVFLILLLLSCHSQKGPSFEIFSLSSDLEFNDSYINAQPILKPANTWVRLLNDAKSCVFFKTAYANNKSILRVVKNTGKCEFDNPVISEEDTIDELSLELIKGDEIVLQVKKNSKVSDIPLMNLSFDKTFNPFDSQIKKSYFGNILIGKHEKVRTIDSGKLCHGVNIECKSIVENNCDKCLEGSYEVVDFNCEQGGSKYCGRDQCGLKNKPACPRGYKTLGTKLSNLCFNGSPAGFCNPGLSTFCNDDGILICI